MADNRRTPPRGSRPRGRTGPGRTTGSGRGGGGRPPQPPPAQAAGGDRPRRPRLTGRAAILVLVLSVLAISYASSMRAYFQQRTHIEDLKTQIAQREANIDELEREKRRWHDPAYVQAQARERFGYLMPGETSYVVLGMDGKPLESQSTLTDPSTVNQHRPTAWWTTEWRSVQLAGVPPEPEAPPATEIDGTEEKQQ
ncbi:hypothetical protein GCM10009844_14760 [Nocardioides koreensis]|uniref:Septum formation initiator family protein n=1 Tax=Nocardioides koreensis TaxID=433651 RepID=A0ABN2ZIX3_9ACTN